MCPLPIPSELGSATYYNFSVVRHPDKHAYLVPAPIPVRRVVVIGIAPVPAAAHESKAVTEMVEMVETIEAGKAGIKAAIKAEAIEAAIKA